MKGSMVLQLLAGLLFVVGAIGGGAHVAHLLLLKLGGRLPGIGFYKSVWLAALGDSSIYGEARAFRRFLCLVVIGFGLLVLQALFWPS